MDNLPLVSIITVNYNTTADTIEFLESAQKLTYNNTEIIVVDNASREDPGEALKSRFPHITYIRSEENLGFAGGNNLGIKVANGKYLFFLNNDTILFPDFLEPVVDFMEEHPDAGMASPKVLFPDGKLQYVGAIGIDPFTGRGKRYSVGEEDKGQFDKNYATALGHGAALIVPRKIIDEIGPMPEDYFLYYEEHDWCEQVKRANYLMYYIGDSKVIHKQSKSTGLGSPLKVYYLTRNRLLFMRRNFSGIPLLIGFIYFTFITIPGNVLKYLVTGNLTLLKAFCRGVVWNMKRVSIT